MKIEILFFEGCPNYQGAVDLVRNTVEDLGLEAEIREIEINSPEDAHRLQFLGSPSIRVDGADIEPTARDRTDFGYSCRTYGGAGLPPRELLLSALTGKHGTFQEGSGGHQEDCCAPMGEYGGKDVAAWQTNRIGLWAGGGSFIAAVVASACCWLPLILIGFGVSAGGIGVMFETTRPIFLGIAAMSLAVGFYYTYFRKEACEPGSVYATGNPTAKRFNQVILWVALLGALTFAFFPVYVGVFIPEGAEGAENTAAITVNGGTSAETVTLEVDGMSCAGCAVTVDHSLMQVPGVLDVSVLYEEGTAIVSVDAASPPAPESLLSAVEKASYQGSLKQE